MYSALRHTVTAGPALPGFWDRDDTFDGFPPWAGSRWTCDALSTAEVAMWESANAECFKPGGSLYKPLFQNTPRPSLAELVSVSHQAPVQRLAARRRRHQPGLALRAGQHLRRAVEIVSVVLRAKFNVNHQRRLCFFAGTVRTLELVQYGNQAHNSTSFHRNILYRSIARRLHGLFFC